MMKIPNSFIVAQMPSMNWLDVKYGIDNSYITTDDASEIALISLDSVSSETQFDLASSKGENSETLYNLVEKLAFNDRAIHLPSEKWLFVYLAWVYEQRDRVSDPLSLAESLYSDFDYPEWVTPIIRYMPAADGEPTGDSYLMKKWGKILQSQRIELSNDKR
ncbi:hypothetical protein CQ054_22975 [Ochrobactrum sp. MYb29]|nr:hypothetical protein CQ054_22975 [Ochrobactrum sp. MYb29]